MLFAVRIKRKGSVLIIYTPRLVLNRECRSIIQENRKRQLITNYDVDSLNALIMLTLDSLDKAIQIYWFLIFSFGHNFNYHQMLKLFKYQTIVNNLKKSTLIIFLVNLSSCYFWSKLFIN